MGDAKVGEGSPDVGGGRETQDGGEDVADSRVNRSHDGVSVNKREKRRSRACFRVKVGLFEI